MILRYLAGLLLAALLAAGARIWWLERVELGLRSTVATQDRQLTDFRQANSSQAQTITDLQAANAGWAKAAQLSAAAAGEAAKKEEEYRRQAIAAAAARPKDTEPDCLAMESLPMAICPMRAAELRELLR